MICLSYYVLYTFLIYLLNELLSVGRDDDDDDDLSYELMRVKQWCSETTTTTTTGKNIACKKLIFYSVLRYEVVDRSWFSV